MKRLLTVIVLALALVGVSATGSIAKVKRIKPSELKPRVSNSVYSQNAGGVRSVDDSQVSFWAEVKLPVGKTIKKLGYYHSGFSGVGAPVHGTHVSLWEKNFGAWYSLDPIMKAESSDYGAGILTESRTLEDYGNGKIKRGYTYSITVTSDNYNSYIHGIEITYK